MSTLATAPLAWYCWQTLPKKEHLAAQLLRRQADLKVLAPRLSYHKKTRRGKVRFVEPLFPGYIFVELEPAATYRRVMATPGVRKIVGYGDQVIPILSSFIADIQARVEADEPLESADPPLAPGMPVLITAGPFEDWEAVVSGLLPAKDRVRLLLDFLGRQMTLDVAPGDLLPRDRNPKATVLAAAQAPKQ